MGSDLRCAILLFVALALVGCGGETTLTDGGRGRRDSGARDGDGGVVTECEGRFGVARFGDGCFGGT